MQPCNRTSAVIVTTTIVSFALMILYYTSYKPRTLYTMESIDTTKSHHQTQVQDNITEDLRLHITSAVRTMMQRYGGVTNVNRTQTKVVLGYTTYFGNKPWGWMKNTEQFNHWQGVKCPYFSCELTFNRRDRPRSDALIFHSRDMPFIDTLRYVLERKTNQQRWIYFAMESPINNPTTNKFNFMFNWTMTYRRDSDVFRPYSYYFESTNITTTSTQELFRDKDRFVFWTSSRCDVPRTKYVEKLLKYVKVDVYGSCGHKVGATDAGPCPKNSKQCEAKLKRYKFQLAFENSFCVDYVTEKYWDGIKKGIVPVVLGGANYTAPMAIPGSFINVMDFKSVKQLADYLKYLDSNDTAYLEYFKWRSKYRVVDYAPWNCLLCARLYLDNKPKVYPWFDTYWNARTQCGIRRKLYEQLVRPDSES